MLMRYIGVDLAEVSDAEFFERPCFVYLAADVDKVLAAENARHETNIMDMARSLKTVKAALAAKEAELRWCCQEIIGASCPSVNKEYAKEILARLP